MLSLLYCSLVRSNRWTNNNRLGRLKLVTRRAAIDNNGSEGNAAGTETTHVAELSTSVDTVSLWLARHAADPEHLLQEQPVWEILDSILGSRNASVSLVRREPRLLNMGPTVMTRNVQTMQRLNMSEAQVRQSIKKCPQLFLQNYESDEMQVS